MSKRFRFSILSFLSLIFIGLVTTRIASAQAVDIGAGGTGPLTGLTTFLQDIMDFMSGPWAIFALAGGVILAVVMWIWMPKEGAMGTLFRVLFGGVIILNVGGWITFLQGMAT